MPMEAFVRVVESGSFVAAAERLGHFHLLAVPARCRSGAASRCAPAQPDDPPPLSDRGRAVVLRALRDLAGRPGRGRGHRRAGVRTATWDGTAHVFAQHGGADGSRPRSPAFVDRHADVKFELVVSDRMVDLVEEGFDLAIRVGPVGSDRLVARRLGSMQLLLCAAPAYLERSRRRRGRPRSCRTQCTDLRLLEHAAAVALYGRRRPCHEVRVTGNLHANSGDALCSAAIGGLGIVNEPDFLLSEATTPGKPGAPAARL